MDSVRIGGGAATGRRGLPLSLIILRYFAYVLAATFAVGLAAYLAFALVLNMGVAYPANEGDRALEETSARLAVLTSDDEAALDAAIPSCYWWTVFAPDGTRLGGDASDRKADLSHEAAFDGLAMEYGVLSTTRYEPVKLADGPTCVLTYEYLPQFTSKEMRDALPNPQNLVLVTAAVLFVAALAGIVTRAARVIARKMRPLTEAAQRIEGHDLDFSVERSGVREIDDVLGAMDEMRASLKESLEAQWRSEQERREQVAALAHDLKTPLTVVRGNLDVLLEGELPDEERACAVDAAVSAARMGEYVRKLIDVSNGDATAFSPVNTNVHLFLGRIHPQANMLATAKDLQLAWHEDPKLYEATLRLDEALLERAILNVVANAVEHAPNNSTVEVDVLADDNEELTIIVSDTGPGFSPEALRRGCEAFYQGDPARAAQGHSGLGLHVAAEAALRHGGAVELANRTDSPGARVTLRIPKA